MATTTISANSSQKTLIQSQINAKQLQISDWEFKKNNLNNKVQRYNEVLSRLIYLEPGFSLRRGTFSEIAIKESEWKGVIAREMFARKDYIAEKMGSISYSISLTIERLQEEKAVAEQQIGIINSEISGLNTSILNLKYTLSQL